MVEITLPSLADRPDDIPLLVQHFVTKYALEMNKPVRGIDNEAMKALMNHPWRGEVRELENVVERAVIFADGELIAPKDLPAMFDQKPGLQYSFDTSRSLNDATAEFEKQYIARVLQMNEYNKENTARALKISLSSLYRKIEELKVPLQG